MNSFYCPDSVPNFLGIFDTTIAPYLLYYAYIPIIAISIFLGIYIFRNKKNTKKPLENYIFFFLTIVFSVFLINDIVQWIAVPVSIVQFGWQLTVFLEFLILFTFIYFILVFLNKGEDVSFKNKLTLFLFSLPVLVFLPTKLNISFFDLVGCEGNTGHLVEYVYFIKILSILFLTYLFIDKINKTKEIFIRKQIILIMFGSVSFLLIFAFSRIFGELTGNYEINLFGSLGVLIFFGFLTYMIVRFQVFNTKVFAAEALMWALIFFVGAQFFFIKVQINFVLNAVSFVSVVILGRFLVRSVEKEIEQKEYLTSLNQELRELIKQREGLVHLITHKVKGSFTRSKYIFSETLQGTYGEITPELRSIVQKGLDSDNEGIKTVDMVLSSVSLQQGKTRFGKEVFNFQDVVFSSFKDKKDLASIKGLNIYFENKEESFNVLGDKFWLKELVNNLIDNAIKYTQNGSIEISLNKKNSKIILFIKDTGMGIDEEDKKVLFTEGGRGKEALRFNTDSTGYGLYTVKLLVEAHNGKVWVESEGKDKGSIFWVELPEAK